MLYMQIERHRGQHRYERGDDTSPVFVLVANPDRIARDDVEPEQAVYGSGTQFRKPFV